MDLRQVMGAVLTLSMFVMLGNMIKRDHFDGDVLLDIPATSNVQQEVFKVSRQSLVELTGGNKIDLLKGQDQLLKPCWNKSVLQGRGHSKGFITFYLTDGPEYHVSQIANAVLVAKRLGATLVLPEIIGYRGDIRVFGEIYDAEKFVTSMNGIIQVERFKAPEISTKKLVTIRVPYKVSENYISAKIQPLFRKSGNLRITTYFPSFSMRQGKVDKHMDPISCLAVFEALSLQQELQEVVDSIVGRLRSRREDGQFAAIDFRADMLQKDVCQKSRIKGMKSCYNMVEVGQFLQKLGFLNDTTIYVTQSRWDSSLDTLKDLYPNTLTKEDIMEEAEKRKFVKGNPEFGDVIDYHICSVSDVFVPAMSGLFYANVVGNRIASGKTMVLVPANITSVSASDHISSYIAKKNHPAYSCFC